MKKDHWLKTEFHLEKWLHKRFLFEDDREFAMFLVWAMLVALLIYNVR